MPYESIVNIKIWKIVFDQIVMIAKYGAQTTSGDKTIAVNQCISFFEGPPFQFSTPFSVGETGMHFDAVWVHPKEILSKYTSNVYRQPRQQRRVQATNVQGTEAKAAQVVQLRKF